MAPGRRHAGAQELDGCLLGGASARLQRCEVLLSEALSHGQDFDGVRVENPFLQDRREGFPGP
jgi:hypothetical protein